MSPPRVLHVFKYFRPRFTGEGIFVERLAPVFAGLRPDVAHDVLVTTTPRPAEPVTPAGLGAVHYLTADEAGGSQRELVAWLAGISGRYGVVHYHTHVDRTFLGSLLLKLRGRRLVLSATLDDSIAGLLKTYRPAFRPLVRRLFQIIDRFVAISPKLFEENNHLTPRDKSLLVPIGIPLPALGADERAACREALAIAPDACVLVSVGGVCERKGQMFLVEQLAGLVAREPRLLLVLVGPVLEVGYKDRIDRFIADHGLEDHVRFAGYVETPWDFYKAADVMVFASREEGFGTVMIEAMAYGLPVVARRLAGVNDSFIDNGRTGYLFTQDEEFQAQVGELLGDPDRRRRMGVEARDHVAAHFDIRDVAARYLDIYGFAAGEAR